MVQFVLAVRISSKTSLKRTFATLLVSMRILRTIKLLMLRVTMNEASSSLFLLRFRIPAYPLLLITLIIFCSSLFPWCVWLSFGLWYSLSLSFLFSCRCYALCAMKSFNNPWRMACSISFCSSIHCSVSWPWSWWKYFVELLLSGERSFLLEPWGSQVTLRVAGFVYGISRVVWMCLAYRMVHVADPIMNPDCMDKITAPL